ncbi:alpha/beta fold hydrolase [Microbacterium rhizophilus]|uniref:alpha/beta fold hydrolase n=1 Tax=Microbacterium rhizophilus TaxID=3138934 RepID=UPI0031E6FD5A
MTTVLLHPIALDRATWRDVPIPGALALDLPGHGDAPWDDPRDLDEVADRVVARAPEGERIDVVGVSLGGMVALHTALRHPDRVRSLVVACAPAATPVEVMRERADATEREGMAGMLASMRERWFSPGVLEARPAYVGEVERRLLADDPRIVAGGWRLIAGHDVADRLAEIRIPVTVVAGSGDTSVPPAAARALAAGLPDAAYVELEGAHMIHLEQPAAFAAAVARHLARV